MTNDEVNPDNCWFCHEPFEKTDANQYLCSRRCYERWLVLSEDADVEFAFVDVGRVQ